MQRVIFYPDFLFFVIYIGYIGIEFDEFFKASLNGKADKFQQKIRF